MLPRDCPIRSHGHEIQPPMDARNLVKLQWTVDAILMTEVFLVTAINEYLTISVVAVLFLSIVLRSMGIVVHLG